jgi:hypothetical protein
VDYLASMSGGLDEYLDRTHVGFWSIGNDVLNCAARGVV